MKKSYVILNLLLWKIGLSGLDKGGHYNCYASERKKQLENFMELRELGSKRKPHEYITAWEMTLKLLEKENN